MTTAVGSPSQSMELKPLKPMALTESFFNIVGEELCWSEYSLPRQELAHGKVTWPGTIIHNIINGADAIMAAL